MPDLVLTVLASIWNTSSGWIGIVDAPSTWEKVRMALRNRLGPPLHALQQPVDAWLGRLPMWVAVGCALGLYLTALIWVWLLPRSYVYRGAPGQERWRDLRIWATVVILPYVGVYLWLGR